MSSSFFNRGLRCPSSLRPIALVFLGMTLALNAHSFPSAGDSSVAPWNPDLGDGRYRNPILFADYSDPDVVRVGDDYWMTSSSFSHVPGLPILHSTDLTHWELVNHALPRLVPEEHFSTPRHGEGVWAPSIRYHDGKFRIFYGDPDFGIYVVTATHPAGEWSKPHLLKKGKGLIDPCPLWDEDGRAYLVHGWAKSRAGFNNILTVHEMAPDASRLLDEGVVAIDGNKLDGWRTLEGPKFHKRDGWYWIFAPAGGVAHGYQAVFRSRDVRGPYEERIVLEQGSTPINGPHQGAWVTTPSGENWFIHFQEHLPYGRIVHLQPMRWREDGWPVMGADPDDDGTGEPVLVHRKPDLPVGAPVFPPTSDDFSGPKLGRQWQWQANPSEAWYSLEDGALRLNCVPWTNRVSLWAAPHLLLQKFPSPAFEATVSLALESRKPGDAVGLIVFGYDYRWIGLMRGDDEMLVVLRTAKNANETGEETEIVSLPVGDSPEIEFKVTVAEGGLCQFAYRRKGGKFEYVGAPFQAKESRWVGAKVGLFAIATKKASSGTAVIKTFTVE